MGRPREHDLDAILDHARRLWADGGAAAVTVRALSAASGVSNGAIYHAFGSLDGLRARVWAREARRFLDLQRSRVEAVLADGGTAADAVVAAALAPGDHVRLDDHGGRVLLSVRPDELVTPGLSQDQLEELGALRRSLDDLVRDLARLAWGRSDRAARVLVRVCLVELPSALLLAPGRPADDGLARTALDRAVRGVLSGPP